MSTLLRHAARFGSVLLLALLTLAQAPIPLSLKINPSSAFSWNGVEPAKFTYHIKGAVAPVVCTGWWEQDGTSSRQDSVYTRSCRQHSLSNFTQTWSNIPHAGNYLGFVELFSTFMDIDANKSPLNRVETPFRVLEGIPQ